MNLKYQNGFTLVELMVVVAIIGLLSSVAIPNFKKYQAKSKISEAKLQLSALYTAQASFFSDYNMYHRCLGYMGYDPVEEYLNRYYAVGFRITLSVNTTTYNAAINSGLNTTDCSNASASTYVTTTSNPNASLYYPGKGIGSSRASVFIHLPVEVTFGDQGSVATMTYTAGAAGVISAGFTTTATSSVLSINQNKVLYNIRNGY